MGANSSTLSDSGAKHGYHWKYQIVFHNYDTNDTTSFSGDDLDKETPIRKVVDFEQKIESVYMLRGPLTKWLPSRSGLYHNFILFNTKHEYWWSIEKNSEGIIIQGSVFPHNAIYYYRQKLREGYKIILNTVSDSSTMTVGELFKWLKDQDELNKPYQFIFCNCQGFASDCFNRMASNKKYHWWEGWLAYYVQTPVKVKFPTLLTPKCQGPILILPKD